MSLKKKKISKKTSKKMSKKSTINSKNNKNIKSNDIISTSIQRSDPCENSISEEDCRVKILHKMYQAVLGTNLLLEQIQVDPHTGAEFNKIKRQEHAFKTLIATILSVRSRDETTMRVIEELWRYYSTPEEMANAPIEHLEELVHSSGTYRQKARRIKDVARIIHEDYNDIVPSDIDLLVSLPGVGRKVANCVLVNSFQIPAIPVDTHVHRISNRLGWVKTKNPEQTEQALMNLFPKSEWSIINYTMVAFGKNICKPQHPLCEKCPINIRCPKNIIKKKIIKGSSKNRKK